MVSMINLMGNSEDDEHPDDGDDFDTDVKLI